MLKDLRKEAAAGHDKFIAVGVQRPDGAAGGALHEAVLPADRNTKTICFILLTLKSIESLSVFGNKTVHR